ncbi:hypothetical protein Spla01_01282 [Streptomyces platensis]|uniref:Uncharacterized protein n=1 Tax=Streptomyces platensis TaxID=58346 RepID=A0ABX3XM63_STRPT|nr:hypothetical protein BG653_06695 [Streptomyces platensis]
MQNTSEVPWTLIGVTDQGWTLLIINCKRRANEK